MSASETAQALEDSFDEGTEVTTETHEDTDPPGSDEGCDMIEGHSDDLREDFDGEGDGVIVIAFRLPDSSMVRRNFGKTSTCLSVKRFVEKLGYPLNRYRVLKSFQRSVVDLDCSVSLKDAGFLSHTVLVIEECDGLDQ